MTANKPSRAAHQGSIAARLDATIARMIEDGLTPRVVYLTPGDYRQLDNYVTRKWREQSGSKCRVYPCSYNDVPIISAKLIDQVEIPVRQRTTLNGQKSTVYSATGVGIPLGSV